MRDLAVRIECLKEDLPGPIVSRVLRLVFLSSP
jgi:hypothetical protein